MRVNEAAAHKPVCSNSITCSSCSCSSLRSPQLKFRIHRQTGTPPDYQKLIIKQAGAAIGEIGPDDTKMIGYYGIESGMEIHCIDLNPYSASANGGYEDVSKVQKYKMR